MNSDINMWRTAAGPLTISMTNDYLFRALLQRNNYVLRGLIASLLHIDILDISSVIITNPITLGDSITDKTFILDIHVILNDNTIINLEMQVINEGNWTERSLSYLCRSFDQLKSGESYLEAKPVIQIGILNFSPFDNIPEFYSTYQMRNIQTNQLYSDKLRISVLDLTCIHLATENDKEYQLDDWARFFKASTWEDLKMLAQNNEYIAEAASTIYQLSEEEEIRLQCQAREDYLRTQKDRKIIQARLDAELAQKKAELAQTTVELADKNAELADKDAELADKNAELADKDAELADKDAELADKDAELADKNAELADKDAQISELRKQMQQLTTELNKYRKE